VSRLVAGCRTFARIPQPYWWRGEYADSDRFDLDNPAHVAYLKRKGIMKVALESGELVEIQSFQEATA
jgi:hypothetical protein